MSDKTGIQWCDSTANPIMGCDGCELFPSGPKVLRNIDREMNQMGIAEWNRGDAANLFATLLDQAHRDCLQQGITPPNEWKKTLTHTNIYHLRFRFASVTADIHGRSFRKPAELAVRRCLKCYAAQLHANRGFDITKPERPLVAGYAKTFNHVTRFPGRMSHYASLPDLTGTDRTNKPWLNGLPRLIFVSDMGDAFSRRADFGYLEDEVGKSILTEEGQRHLWLWLTKRPDTMAAFASRMEGFPRNVCAMTTVTSSKQLGRVQQLQQVDAHARGLSIEPLWDSVADRIDLDGIDWVIVGGESGAKAKVASFQVDWVRELKMRCHQEGVAFFVKQLGRRPVDGAEELNLSDPHGGDWDEWPMDLRIREMPAYFRDYEPSQTGSGELAMA